MARADIRVDFEIDARLMGRLLRYAREHGMTPEAVLRQSAIAFLDGTALSDDHPAERTDAVKRVPRK